MSTIKEGDTMQKEAQQETSEGHANVPEVRGNSRDSTEILSVEVNYGRKPMCSTQGDMQLALLQRFIHEAVEIQFYQDLVQH